MRLSKSALVLVVSLVVAAPASAAVDVFLQIPGVPGFATDVKHQGWIEVLSYSLAVGESTGDKTKDIQSRCSASFLTDLGAGLAPAVSLVGKPLAGEVRIDHMVLQTGVVLTEIKLQGAVINGISSAHPGPAESLSLNFTTIEIVTREQKPDGSAGQTRTGRYDCAQPK